VNFELAFKMHTNVTFRHTAKFVPLSDEDGIIAVNGAQWFVALLRRVHALEIDENLCQEDWGVVLFARRNRLRFWIGLSAWNAQDTWLAHFHYGSLAWLQRFGLYGKNELTRLMADVHGALAGDAAISDIAWYEESEMHKPHPAGFPTPIAK
jgi:hypothetical protein